MTGVSVASTLDAGYLPAIRRFQHHRENGVTPLVIGLERHQGAISRFETIIDPAAPDVARHVERLVKFLVWAWGGWKVHLGGPTALGGPVSRAYAAGGSRAFDADMMQRIYGRPFEVIVTDPAGVPPAAGPGSTLGGHLDGCRIGFDLGASDYKVAAVRDGQAVYSDEFPWNPKDQPDPEYHYTRLTAGLKAAAAHLPRVDAIGGSSAGVIVDSEIRVASLFRSVPADRFARDVQPMFRRIRDEWGVPLEVWNDGDVTALAAALALEVTGVLGIAMGSSEAAGYFDRHGQVTGWLNELAFAPVDDNPAAATDEWSGDRGVGALYFSQQAVNKLLSAAGIRPPDSLDLPGRLVMVQERMTRGDEAARRIYEMIGVYLGQTIPLYREFYDFRHLLVLGRVTSGAGGAVMIDTARRLLETEFPEIAAGVSLHVPDEKSKRVGQALAAASLPVIK